MLVIFNPVYEAHQTWIVSLHKFALINLLLITHSRCILLASIINKLFFFITLRRACF